MIVHIPSSSLHQGIYTGHWKINLSSRLWGLYLTQCNRNWSLSKCYFGWNVVICCITMSRVACTGTIISSYIFLWYRLMLLIRNPPGALLSQLCQWRKIILIMVTFLTYKGPYQQRLLFTSGGSSLCREYYREWWKGQMLCVMPSA